MEIVKKIICRKGKELMNEASVIKRTQEHIFAGLARGKKESIYGRKGAQITLNQLYEYIKKQEIENILDGYMDQKQYELIKSIRENIQKAAEYTVANLSELSCTFCCLYVDRKTDQFIAVHLGDGQICGITREGKYVRISAPEYGPTKFHTFHTMMDGALSHIRFLSGDITTFQDIFLFSTEIRNVDRMLKNIEKRVYEDESKKYCTLLKELKKYDNFTNYSTVIMTNI